MNGYSPEKHRLVRSLRKNERVCSGKIPISLPTFEGERVCSFLILVDYTFVLNLDKVASVKH